MPFTSLTPRASTLVGTLILIGSSIGSSLLGQTSCTSVTFDGYTYNAVKIGDQCWFSNNLRTTVYADGTSIPEITGTSEWSNTSASQPSLLDAYSALDMDAWPAHNTMNYQCWSGDCGMLNNPGASDSKYIFNDTDPISAADRAGGLSFTCDWASSTSLGARFVAKVNGTWYGSEQIGMTAGSHGSAQNGSVTTWVNDETYDVEQGNWYASLTGHPTGWYAWRDNVQWSNSAESGLPAGEIEAYGFAWLSTTNNMHHAIKDFEVYGTATGSVGARCNHENNAGNVNVHGRLYNWFAVTDASGICPTGWDVPSSSDWEELETHLGANGYSGNEGTALKAAIGWDDGTGTNAVGFNGRASGHRNLHGNFGSFGEKGRFWSTTDVAHNEGRAWSYTLQENQSHIHADEGCWYTAGVSVRCMRDAVTGCTDSGACNYTAAANSDDGSCTFNSTWYADADGDGLGDASDSQSACTQPSGYVADSSDNCEDTSACNYDDNANGSCNYTTAAAQNTSVQLDVNGSASVVAANLDNGSTGCGGIASYSLSQSTFGCSDIGTNNVTFTVTDEDGNTASTAITVTVTQTDTDGDGILDCNDLCSDNTAINYNLLPQEDCAFDCDGLDAPLVFTGLALSSKASSPDVSDGEVNLTFSGGYGTKAAHFSGATPHTTGTHNFSLAASLSAVPQGHWSVYVTDEAGCEGRCDGCGNTNRVTLQVVVPHERCD